MLRRAQQHVLHALLRGLLHDDGPGLERLRGRHDVLRLVRELAPLAVVARAHLELDRHAGREVRRLEERLRDRRELADLRPVRRVVLGRAERVDLVLDRRGARELGVLILSWI